jgi:hypothetical protein
MTADLVTIVDDIMAGKGTVGRLLRDEELAVPPSPADADGARSPKRPSQSSTPGNWPAGCAGATAVAFTCALAFGRR